MVPSIPICSPLPQSVPVKIRRDMRTKACRLKSWLFPYRLALPTPKVGRWGMKLHGLPLSSSIGKVSANFTGSAESNALCGPHEAEEHPWFTLRCRVWQDRCFTNLQLQNTPLLWWTGRHSISLEKEFSILGPRGIWLKVRGGVPSGKPWLLTRGHSIPGAAVPFRGVLDKCSDKTYVFCMKELCYTETKGENIQS